LLSLENEQSRSSPRAVDTLPQSEEEREDVPGRRVRQNSGYRSPSQTKRAQGQQPGCSSWL